MHKGEQERVIDRWGAYLAGLGQLPSNYARLEKLLVRLEPTGHRHHLRGCKPSFRLESQHPLVLAAWRSDGEHCVLLQLARQVNLQGQRCAQEGEEGDGMVTESKHIWVWVE
jgi:hypothetical protein